MSRAEETTRVVEAFVGTVAFFLSPRGELMSVDGPNHITAVIRSPGTFGLTRSEIESIYDKYHEPLGQEGKAREEILLNLVRAGWMRMRRYPNKFWSINVFKISSKVKDLLYDWANNILKGTWGFKEADPYMPVKIDFSGGQITKYTVQDIAQDKLFNENLLVGEEFYKVSSDRVRFKITFIG